MRLSYSIRSKVNTSPRFMKHSPEDWAKREDWTNFEGKFSCDNGRYSIVEDPKYGLVISEKRNLSYGASGSL